MPLVVRICVGVPLLGALLSFISLASYTSSEETPRPIAKFILLAIMYSLTIGLGMLLMYEIMQSPTWNLQ